MLGARHDRMHARGSGHEGGSPAAEEYWAWGPLSRLKSGSWTMATGPAGSTTTAAGGRSERGPGGRRWLGWTDRLLQPQHLYIWGRPGEDWRLGRVVGWSTVAE